jgi:hypothetical protein
MIDPLDGMLRDVIQSRVAGFIGPTQVGFGPPNADWKAAVIAAGEERFNLYLYDMRENVRLRSNEPHTSQSGGLVTMNLPSPRLDCTYLVTAWSPVAPGPLLDPAREEHQLLYRALAVFMQFRPLDAGDVYATPVPSGMTLAAFTAAAPALAAQPLPFDAASPDAPHEPAEFWTTLKVDSRPAIRLTVTIPVVLEEPDLVFPGVTTLTARYYQLGTPGTPDTILAIGGRVLSTGTDAPIDGAWVQIVGKTPPAITAVRQRTVTDLDGRFIFSRLPRGSYELRAVAPGLADKTFPPFDVPLAAGTYDVHLP